MTKIIIKPGHFLFQVIEVFIRAEDGLCREVVKHLNQIEEQILDHLAWKPESPLWDRIRDNENRVPTCEEVCENTLTSFCNKSITGSNLFIFLFHGEQLNLVSPLWEVRGWPLGLIWYSHPCI